MSLHDAYTPRRAGDRYELAVPPGWRQGRGAYGGLVVGSLIHAIEGTVAAPARKLRSVTAELPGPVDDTPAMIAVEVLRAGSAVTTARAALSQAGAVKTHAVAVLAADRPSATEAWQELVAPTAPAWRSITPLPLGPSTAFGPPEFTQHFEYRVTEGMPHAGGPARSVGWIRARDRGPARGAAYIAALIDAWWPAAMVKFARPRPLATIVYTLDVVSELDGLDPDAPLLYRGTVPVCRDGYFLETRELWGEDGRLIAINQQTFAVIA